MTQSTESKPAEEWFESIDRFNSLSIHDIRAIQLDATSAALRKAAEILDAKCLHLNRPPWTLDIQDAHKAILALIPKGNK